MMIFRRDGGVLGEVRRFSTSKSHGVRGKTKMLLVENWSKIGVKAFDDGNQNLNPLNLTGKGAPCQFYSSSAAIHSDSSVNGNIARGRSTRAKLKTLKTLLDEDTSGGTKSSTTRKMFHDAIKILGGFDKPSGADTSIKLLEKMWDWDKAGNKRLTPTRGEDMRDCTYTIRL